MSGWFRRHQVAVCCVVSGLTLIIVAFVIGFYVREFIPYPYQVNSRVVLP